jgi:hypothetical protein
LNLGEFEIENILGYESGAQVGSFDGKKPEVKNFMLLSL